MKRRSLETRFWKDSYIQSLTSNGKLLFNYLLMNEYVNIIHIYELPETYISLETGLTIKQIQDLKVKFQKDGKFLFKENWIKIINADKYENYVGEKNDTAKKNLLKNISSDIIGYFDTPIDTSIDTQSIGTSNQQPIINNQKPVNNIILEKDILEISNKYSISENTVKDKLEAIRLWEEEKPGRMKGRNWKATLMNWIRRDIENGKIKKISIKIEPNIIEQSPEEKAKALQKLEEVKNNNPLFIEKFYASKKPAMDQKRQ